MTVQAEVPQSSYTYTGPGDYDFSYLAAEPTEIKVTHTTDIGLETELVYGTDYTVVLADPIGGTVSITYADASMTSTILVYRDTTIDQQTNLINNDPLDMDILERAYDKLTMILQEQGVGTFEITSRFVYRGIWNEPVTYYINDVVQYPDDRGSWYGVKTLHNSTAGSTPDVDTHNYEIILDIGDLYDQTDAAIAAAAAAAISEANAAASEANAATSETNAATSETNAGVSAGNAASSEANASASAMNAAVAEVEAEDARDFAQEWSSRAEDVLINDNVNPPGYSSYHWSLKSEAASVTSWGQITGDINLQTDLQTQFDTKEDWLDVPSADGDLLSSTIAGVRTWIPAAAGGVTSWGTIVGDIATQTDLQDQFAVTDGNVSTNAGNISTNAGNIATNTADISTNATNLSDHEGAVNPHGALMEVVDDATPQLGGNLETVGNEVRLTSAGGALQGMLTDVAIGDLGAALVYSTDGTYVDTAGAVVVDVQGVELHGTSVQINTLEGIDNRQVYCTPSGLIYSVVPPAPGWSETDTDTATAELPTLGLWVEMNNLFITVPEDVADGDRIDVYAALGMEERGGRAGTVGVGFGINGSPPGSGGVISVISENFQGVIPTSMSTTTHGGIFSGDTVTVWVQRDTQTHNQFEPWLDSSIALHELVVSVPGEGGSATGAVWGTITGTMSNQSDLNAALNLKSNTSHLHTGIYEPVLGNPAANGYHLASQTDGTRSWEAILPQPVVVVKGASFTVSEADGFDVYYSCGTAGTVVTIPDGLSKDFRFTVLGINDTTFGTGGSVNVFLPTGKILAPYGDGAAIGFVVTGTNNIDAFGDLADA